MNRDPWRYQTRSAAYKHIRRRLDGKEAMVLQCNQNLGLSPRQRELVCRQALRVAEDIVMRRGSWGVARATLVAAAASLTDQVADGRSTRKLAMTTWPSCSRSRAPRSSGSSSGTS